MIKKDTLFDEMPCDTCEYCGDPRCNGVVFQVVDGICTNKTKIENNEKIEEMEIGEWV